MSMLNLDWTPIPIIKPIWDGKVKHAPNQKLTEGIYPEHFVYPLFRQLN